MAPSREIPVGRPSILIVSDETDFSEAVTGRWLREPVVPSFLVRPSTSAGQLGNESFDLAVAGGLSEASLAAVASCLRPHGKPVVYVGSAAVSPGANGVQLPEVPGWPDLVVTLGTCTLECREARAEASRLEELNLRLEQLAALGRYLVEMRHKLNNALTSILGNSDLILLDPAPLTPAVRAQVETIRNMGLRMNEIMQRFSSLQKEMQLVEEQKKAVGKSAAGRA
jgi:signal transduction histidine kinase